MTKDVHRSLIRADDADAIEFERGIAGLFLSHSVTLPFIAGLCSYTSALKRWLSPLPVSVAGRFSATVQWHGNSRMGRSVEITCTEHMPSKHRALPAKIGDGILITAFPEGKRSILFNAALFKLFDWHALLTLTCRTLDLTGMISHGEDSEF